MNSLISSVSSAAIFLSAGFLLVFPVRIAPRFADLFKDFGGELPPLTRLVMSPWCSLAALLLLLGGVAAALIRPRERAIILSLTAGGGVVLVVLFVTALYLPIFTLAGKIQ